MISFLSIDVSALVKTQKRSIESTKTDSKVAAPIECTLCKYIVNYVDALMKSNHTQAEIDAALDKACAILPKSISAECQKFVGIYGPVIPQLIIAYGSPDAVCDAIHICNNGTATVQLPIRKFESFRESYNLNHPSFRHSKKYKSSNSGRY